MNKVPRILFLFVNYAIIGGHQPVGIASLAAMLKKHGYNFDFFDTSFILKNPSYEESQDGFIKTPLNQIIYKQKSLTETIEIFLKKYNPSDYDIVLTSSMTTTHPPTKEFIKVIRGKNPKVFTIVGGIHATVLPKEVISDPNVDAICIGEGEESIIEFLDCFSRKIPHEHVKNFWFKKGKDIIKNSLRPRVNLDSLPYPDYTIFTEDHFYGPFVGKIYKTMAIEISRGCPFCCSYCANKLLQDLYGGVSKYHSEQSFEVAIKKLVYLKERFKPEFLRFIDESFTVMSPSYLEGFAKEYKKNINIPFWVQTTAATLNEKKVRLLKSMNCVALTIGAEHGNEKFRKTVLKKNITDDQIFRSMALLKKYDIRRSAYFMIGLPFETRALILDTIKMYKRLVNEYGAAPSGIQCFYPFPGCELYDVCIKDNFISDRANSISAISKPALDMPDLSYDEILRVKRTFFAYSVLEERLYPIVKICEDPNPYTDKILEAISNIYAR